MKPEIRVSTDADMRAIHKWLVKEGARGIHNFLCNWDLTKKCHKEGRVLVFIDDASRVPVGYQWGSLNHAGILEVRHDMRRKGIGRRLVERRIAEAYCRDECLLLIECTPATSVPFWQTMGFTPFCRLEGTRGEIHAYRVLEKKHQLPANGQVVRAKIRFYPEERKQNKMIWPYCTAAPFAVRTPDGVVHLSERVFFFKQLHAEWDDSVVEIEINGQLRFCDKPKRTEANHIGVRRCHNGFYIDRIHPFDGEQS